MNTALLQGAFSQLKQTECEVIDHFAPGVYLRECRMPKDTWIIGKTHKTEHFNQLIEGECLVSIDDDRVHLKAPVLFKAKPGKKVIYTLKDTVWLNIHPTEETNLDKLEEELLDLKAEEQIKIDYESHFKELKWVG